VLLMNLGRTRIILGAIPFAILLASVACTESTNATTIRVRAIMKDVEAGKLHTGPPGPFSGWIMTNEDGKPFHRSILQAQATPIIALGQDAVPELIKWVDHGEMQVRYVAKFSLEKITGVRPFFPTFATLQELRSKGWLEASVRSWTVWYEANGGRR